jgi:multisubunit Na+/H+ antiporter MnhF subunit
MVTRTAFTQLKLSTVLLVAVMLALGLVFLVPWLAIVVGPGWQPRLLGVAAAMVMAAAFLPVCRFYALPWSWSLTLPVAGLLFGLMTMESAVNYWRGTKARWKGRTYAAR